MALRSEDGWETWNEYHGDSTVTHFYRELLRHWPLGLASLLVGGGWAALWAQAHPEHAQQLLHGEIGTVHEGLAAISEDPTHILLPLAALVTLFGIVQFFRGPISEYTSRRTPDNRP